MAIHRARQRTQILAELDESLLRKWRPHVGEHALAQQERDAARRPR